MEVGRAKDLSAPPVQERVPHVLELCAFEGGDLCFLRIDSPHPPRNIFSN